MAYVALKPCRFVGQTFRIGEAVPDELIHPGAVKNLLKMQVLAIQDNGIIPANNQEQIQDNETVQISVPAEEGDIMLDVSPEGLQAIFNVLSGKAADAESIIEKMDEGDALILLHLVDSRKTIKEAAEARAKEIEGEQ